MRVIEAKGFRVAYDPQVPALSVRWAPPPYALTKEIDDVRHVDYGLTVIVDRRLPGR